MRGLEAATNQVRCLDKKCPGVAPETGHDLTRKRVPAIVIQVVVVACVESRSGTRRPAKQRLRTQAGVERVVVENQPSESRVRELVRTAQGQDVDGKSDAIGIVATQSLRVDIELRAQLVGRLISNTGVELQQLAGARIEWRVLA